MTADTCPCGCAVAAWSMPWPAGHGGAAAWTPAPVHPEAPGRAPGALFPVDVAEEIAEPTLSDLTTDHTERNTR